VVRRTPQRPSSLTRNPGLVVDCRSFDFDPGVPKHRHGVVLVAEPDDVDAGEGPSELASRCWQAWNPPVCMSRYPCHLGFAGHRSPGIRKLTVVVCGGIEAQHDASARLAANDDRRARTDTGPRLLGTANSFQTAGRLAKP
jgi:hypothetical protein